MSIKINVPYSYELYASMKDDVPEEILIPFLQKLYSMELERDMVHFEKEEVQEDLTKTEPVESVGIEYQRLHKQNYNILDIYHVQSQRETKETNEVSSI